MGDQRPQSDQCQASSGRITDHIESVKGCMGGTPVLKGSRFPFAQILAELSEGDRSLNEIAKAFDWDQFMLEDAKFGLDWLASYINQNTELFKDESKVVS